MRLSMALVSLGAAILVGVAGCDRSTTTRNRAGGTDNSHAATPADGKTKTKLKIFASIPPHRYFIQRVGGDLVDVSVLLPAGKSPATYEITPKQMVELGQADLLFRTGVPFEDRLVSKIAKVLPALKIVDLREGLDLIKTADDSAEGNSQGDHHAGHSEDDHADHDHDGDDDDDDHEHHHHGELDPHVWMSTLLVKRQADTIRAALTEAMPGAADIFAANARSFATDLQQTHDEIQNILAPLKVRAFFVFHPAYGYFAREYGLEQVAVEYEGKAPTAKRLAELIARAKASGVRLIFVQPQFAGDSANAVAEAINGAVVPLDPLAEDYLPNLKRAAEQIRGAFGE